MKNELQPHIKTINGQKVIDEQGAEIIRTSFKPVSNGLNPIDNNTAKNADNSALNSFELDLTLRENESLKEQINTLKYSNNAIESVLTQFKMVQNDEILFLREQNKTLLEKVGQQSDQIAELAEKLTELNRNQQVLLKQEQNKNTLLISDERPKAISTEDSRTDQNNKKGFLKRLFNKKDK